MRNTDEDWRKVAAENPYWGVLSVDRFRGKRLSASDLNAFFESGDQYLKQVLNMTRRQLQPGFEIGRALDFGCGVGRLAIPIARAASGEVIGVDISEEMLKICAQHAQEQKIENLTLVKGDDTLSGVDGRFNFINTFIVLQHIPPSRGLALIERLLSLLDVDGIASIQVTYAKARKFLKHEDAKSAYYRREGETIIELGVRPDERPSGSITMFDYDLNQVFAIVQEYTRVPMVVRPTNDDGHLGVHIIVKRAGAR